MTDRRTVVAWMALLSVGSSTLIALGQRPGEKDWVAPEGPNSAALRRVLIEPIEPAVVNQTVLALGPDAAPEIRAFLTHPNPSVKRRAFRALLLFPEIAKDAIQEAKTGRDTFVRAAAMRALSSRLADPEMRQMFINWVTEPEPRVHPRTLSDYILRKPPEMRAKLANEIVPRVVKLLRNPDQQGARLTVRRTTHWIHTLGQIAPPGDADTLDVLRQIESDYHRRFLDGANPVRVEGIRARFGKLRDALGFALASLGDREAMARFREDALHGPKEGRLLRLRELKLLQPSPAAFDLARALLDDRTDIHYAGPSHSSHGPMKRACDFAVEAAAQWIPEIRKVAGIVPLIYQDDQIDGTRELLTTALAAVGGYEPPETILTSADRRTGVRRDLAARVRDLILQESGAAGRDLSRAERQALDTHVELWTSPIERLPQGLLDRPGQQWYLDSVRFFRSTYAEATKGRPDRLTREWVEHASRHWLADASADRSGQRTSAQLVRRAANSVYDALELRLTVLSAADERSEKWHQENRGRLRSGVQDAAQRWIELSDNVFVGGWLKKLPALPSEWQTLVERLVDDIVPLRAGTPIDNLDVLGPRILDSVVWESVDDSFGRRLARRAIEGERTLP